MRVELAPWPGKPGRRMCLLDPVTAAAYEEAVEPAVPAIERLLEPWAVGNRVVALRPLRLEPWREARARYRAIAEREAARAGLALRIDVRECYRTISAGAVDAALRAGEVVSEHRGRIAAALDAFARGGIAGLPVGPAPSAVLANLVLAAADRALAGERWLRWVDDLVVFAPDAARLAEAERRVTTALAALGLATHPAKRRTAEGPVAVLRLALATASGGPGAG